MLKKHKFHGSLHERKREYIIDQLEKMGVHRTKYGRLVHNLNYAELKYMYSVELAVRS